MLRTLLCAVLCAASMEAGPLLFRASLTSTATADYAAGDREPLVRDRVRFDSAAVFPPTASLTYDARANMYAEQGTVSFFWRPDQAPGRVGFPLFNASYEQHGSWDFNFARIDWTGLDLAARVRDRNMEFHTVRAPFRPAVGRWTHIAMSWSETGGLAFYVDGKAVGSLPGPWLLDAGLDQFGFLTRAVTPHHTAGGEDPGAIRDARVYSLPMPPEGIAALAAGREPADAPRAAPNWAARFGWSESAGIPEGTAFRVRRVGVREAFDIKKLWLKATDGKRDTLWPTFLIGYSEEGKALTIYPEAEPVNYVRASGNLKGRIVGVGPRAGTNEVTWHALGKTAVIDKLTIERESGVLGEVELLNVDATRTFIGSRGLETFQPAAAGTFRWRRDPEAFADGRYHYLVSRSAGETGLRGVRLRIFSKPGAFYTVAVEDPVNTVRDLIEAEFRANGTELDLALEFPDIVVPAGRAVVVRLASSEPKTTGLMAWLTSALPEARKRHVAQRIPQIRDSFQMLCEARPWMTIGRSNTRAALRRRLKLVDELYTLLEDVRRVQPDEPIAAAYWGWINRLEPPPAFAQPAPANSATPLWAFRQLLLVRQLRKVADWWIDNRQIETGELGGDIGDDSDLVQNWPAVGLLDEGAERYKTSVRALVEAAHRLGRITDGFNTHRTDALHAYEEGMNIYPPAFLLDYGNPVLAERMMATARHYFRIMGVNQAGHRHFRSILYSATDLVEEGYHAREDMYSHLILHPGLYLAWYNGSPRVTKLLGEYADALLAHWKTERYPALARGIFFADDRVENRGSPFTDVWNIFWGLWDTTGDERYLWLLRAAIDAGDVWSATGANGPWTGLFAPGELRGKLAAEVEKRRIFDHNLQTDQGGTVARVLAWQAGGDLKLVEEAQAAMVQHMAQNMYLYTDAQQFDDRIWIPTLATQRERLGGVAHSRNCIYPGHAVSWEATGGEVAFLVPEAGRDKLRIVAFNTGAKARRVRGRVWQLEHGRYEMTVGTARSTLALKRYAPFEFDAPAGKEVTVQFRQLEKRRPLTELPDLAIAREEVRGAGSIELTVHNIGAAASRPFNVTVRDRSGKLLGETAGPALAAPDDLQPKTAALRIAGVAPRAGLRITVAQQGGGDEICDENNEVVLQ